MQAIASPCLFYCSIFKSNIFSSIPRSSRKSLPHSFKIQPSLLKTFPAEELFSMKIIALFLQCIYVGNISLAQKIDWAQSFKWNKRQQMPVYGLENVENVNPCFLFYLFCKILLPTLPHLFVCCTSTNTLSHFVYTQDLKTTRDGCLISVFLHLYWHVQHTSCLSKYKHNSVR